MLAPNLRNANARQRRIRQGQIDRAGHRNSGRIRSETIAAAAIAVVRQYTLNRYATGNVFEQVHCAARLRKTIAVIGLIIVHFQI